MKCNQSTWCEYYVISRRNPKQVVAAASEEVETVEVILTPQQPPAIPPDAMNYETVHGDQDSSPPPTDSTEGQLGDD